MHRRAYWLKKWFFENMSDLNKMLIRLIKEKINIYKLLISDIK